MTKCLLLPLLFASFIFAGTDMREQYLKYYYDGDYEKAHSILRKTFSDPFDLEIWEARLHVQQQIPGCDFLQKESNSARALALLRIGQIESAKAGFKEDNASLLGRATLSLWQNDYGTAQKYVQQGLRQSPEFPQFVFLAANLAETDEEALEYFNKYLALNPSDQLNVLSARQAIDFVTKTKGLPLNVASLDGDSESLNASYSMGRFVVKAKINGKKDVSLLIDTGAAGLSLEKKNWQPKIVSDLLMIGLGKNEKTTGQRAVFDQFSAGKFQLKNPVAAISESLHSSGIDGIVGSILFSKYAIVLPLKSGKSLTLIRDTADRWLEKNTSHFSTRVTLPFYSVNKMIIVKGKIKKSNPDMDILIDTGAYRSVVSAATAKRCLRINYALSHAANQKPHLFGLGGQVENVLVADNVEVELGSIKKEFNRMLALNLSEISEALELEVDLILGQDMLEGYTLLIDYRNNKITFLK